MYKQRPSLHSKFMTFDALKQEVQKLNQATAKIQAFLPNIPKRPLVRLSLILAFIGAFLGTYLIVISTNLILDWYFAVPSPDKFINVKGTEIALYTHDALNYNVQQESQLKIASLEVEGSSQGLIVNQEVEKSLNIPLQVKGALIALDVNSKIGQTPETPLDSLNGYREGVTSSYIAGNNYYPQQQKLNPTGYQKGLEINAALNQELDLLDLFNSSLALLDSSNAVLIVNINTLLNQSSNRADTLNNYINSLTDLEEKLILNQSQVNVEIDYWNSEERASRSLMTQNEKNFFTALRNFEQPTTANNLEEFITIRQQNVNQKAHLQAMTEINEYINFYMPEISLRKEALLANRDALVHGIKVVAFRDIDLGLINEK